MVAEISLVDIMIKLIFVLWKNEEILAFLYDPVDGHSEKFLDSNFEQGNQKMETFIKYVQIFIFMVVFGTMFICLSCLPIFSSGRKLPLFVEYSVNGKYSDILYYVTFAFAVSGLFIAGLFNLSTVLIWYIIIQYSIAYEILGNQIAKLGMNGDDQKTLYVQNLISSIKDHHNLVE